MKKYLSLFALFALLLGAEAMSSIPTVAAATYTATQVSTHNSAADCWTIINNKVYDITPYVPMHPGGVAAITSICGINGTATFGGIHSASATANTVLAGYYVGDLAVPDTSAPSIPTVLSAAVVSSSQINLNWAASTDNIAITGYKIYRNGGLIGTTTSNSYNNAGLSPATTYSYAVSAFDAAGNNSNQSNLIIATTLAAGTTAPPPITPPTATTTPPNYPKHYDDDDNDEEDEHINRANYKKNDYDKFKKEKLITIKLKSKIRFSKDGD